MNLTNDVVIHFKNEGQEYLQFRRLLEYSNIISHCYSVGIERSYRTFKANREPLAKEEYEKNLENYKTLCDANALNYENIVKANQAHTDNIIKVDTIEKENSIIQEAGNYTTIDTLQKSDGLITNKKDIILATTNADCILLLLFDPVKKVIANIHSGWKGTLQRISVKAVEKMNAEYGCDPKDIIVCISPSIRKCHFEVEEDVYKMFYDEFKNLGNVKDFTQEKNGKWNIDTVLINKIILKNAGILEENIEDSRNMLCL